MAPSLFSLANLAALPLWGLMILLPHWRWTHRIVGSPLVAAPFAVVYAALVLPVLGQLLPALVSPRLPIVAELLADPAIAAVAWVHFLAFDLFVGRWAFLAARAQGISAWLMGPILVSILLVGPLGFLLFLAARAAHRVSGCAPAAPESASRVPA